MLLLRKFVLSKESLENKFGQQTTIWMDNLYLQVLKLIWWEHNCKSGQYSSAKVHGSLKVNADGSYVLSPLDGLTPDAIDGF